MKTLIKLTPILLLLLTAVVTNGQVQESTKNKTKAVLQDDKATTKQAPANHNTTRSNKTSSIAAPGNTGSGGNQGSGAAKASKKGYDYYKANSDQGKTKSGARDYNSSRSNTTSIMMDDGTENTIKKKGIDDKTNKSEAARSKRKVKVE